MTPADTQFATAIGKLERARLRNVVPPADEVKSYADQLPQIYKDILAGLQLADPNRAEGEAVALGTLRNHLLHQGKTYSDLEVELALDQLAKEYFVDESESNMWFTPTGVGEALITSITVSPTKKATIPELPAPPWRR